MDLKQLKKKHNLTDLELFKQNTSTQKISFTANNVKQTETNHHAGSAVRLIHNNKIGFCASFGNFNTEEAVLKAKDISNFYPDATFKFPSAINISETKNAQTNNGGISELKNEGKGIIEKILNSISSNSALVDISFEINNFSESIENSNDLLYSHSKTIYSSLVSIRETVENDFIEIYTVLANNEKPNFDKSINELIQLYKLSKKHAKIKNGSFPVLFTSKAAKDLLGIVELALSGKQVNQKSSPWHNMLGKEVSSNSLTIRQDPSFGYMARSVDDEGSIVQPFVLIENGTLKNFYYDLSSASKSNRSNIPSGNGFKPSLISQPEASLLNLIVSPGNESLEKIIKSIDYGILVDQAMGSLTANISGDISMNVDAGFLIDKGELIGRVKDTMVSGNIYTALKNIVKLSNDPKWEGSNIYNPDMLLDGFTVTS